MSALKSVVWEFFKIDNDNESFAKCNNCNKSVSRGGNDRNSYGLNNLRKHLKTTHPALHNDLCNKEKVKETEKQSTAVKPKQQGTQSTLESSFIKIWDINCSQSQEIIYAIAEFICTDMQPVSVVEDVGFNRLLKRLQSKFKCPSRRYFTEKIIPDIFERVTSIIKNEINGAESISFTSDIWSSRSNDSYMSLTAHFIDSDYKRKEYAVCCSYFPGEHTGEKVGEKMIEMLDALQIDERKRHLILRDGGTNYVAGTVLIFIIYLHFNFKVIIFFTGFRLFDLKSATCLAHLLQNVINEGNKSFKN